MDDTGPQVKGRSGPPICFLRFEAIILRIDGSEAVQREVDR